MTHSLLMLRIILLSALVCTAATGGTARAQTSDSPPDESASTGPAPNSITGRVVTQSGQPVTNATVSVLRLNSASPPRPAPAGMDGSFKFAGLEPGVFTITASAPSYIPLLHASGNAATDYYRIGDAATITMIKGGVINGTVTSTDGQPVVAVRVRALMIRDVNGQPVRGGTSTERQTDDRGIYRLYGLLPGTYVVFAGGASPGSGGGGGGTGAGGFGGRGGGGFGGGGRLGFATAVYDRDAPTFAPSSTRDTAAEISVFPGEEVSNVDIKYRGEPGHAVSGSVKTLMPQIGAYARTIITLSRAGHEGEVVSSTPARGAAFAFYGVADDEYDVSAQTSAGPDDEAVSQPRRIYVKGANVTGLVLTVSPLAAISGRLLLEPSAAPECKNKRQPRLEETLLSVQRNPGKDSEGAPPPQFSGATVAAGKNGDFFLSKLGPGQYRFDTRFFAKYWYLRAMTLPSAKKPVERTKPANEPAGNPPVDAARNGVALKFGSRITGMIVNLAEGAASVKGHVAATEDGKLAPGLFVYLVPAEKEHAENVLRFFAASVGNDGSFTLSNLSPGLYWAVAGPDVQGAMPILSKLRMPEGAETRAKLRREGEAVKTSIELKACQNVVDYQLPFSRQ